MSPQPCDLLAERLRRILEWLKRGPGMGDPDGERSVLLERTGGGSRKPGGFGGRFALAIPDVELMLKASDSEFDTEALRERLAGMDDEALRRFGRSAAYMCSPYANHCKPPREVFRHSTA
jgi:hypothetical protein